MSTLPRLPRLPGLPFVGLVLSLMVVLTSCGVPSSDGAEPLPTDVVVIGPTEASPTPEESAISQVEVAWVDSRDQLVLTPRLAEAVTRQEILDAAITALIGGPNDAELGAGLSTTIPVDAELNAVLRGRKVLVDVVEAGSSRPELLLSVGQVAVTVLAVPRVRSVVFVSDGDRANVPIPLVPDGVERPLTLRDYQPILSE